ncbi:MAG: hypothetical protein ACFCU8_03065 [Thermosynechococcaceae cyanobacterium]
MKTTNATVAQKALFELWESLDILHLDDDGLQDAIALTVSTAQWQGTLQDASIIVIALKN